MFAFPLYFIRHGETFYNAEGRVQGQLDTPLSPLGREQAREAGGVLKGALAAARLAPEDFGWFASPLSRAVDTMALAREAMHLPETGFSTDPRLMELNFGAWQNLTWPEIRARDARGAAARKSDIWNYAPPGGESYAMLAERVKKWLAEREGPIVAVAHGGVARVLMAMLGGVAPVEAAVMPVYQGRVLALSEGTGRWLPAAGGAPSHGAAG